MTRKETELDYISRQALKDLGAECIAKRDENGNLIPLGCIDNLPSVSTEKPNRCKDCSYFQSREKAVYINTNGMKVTNGSHTCFYWDGSGVPEDGFCHNFEKMEAKEARRLIGGE